MKREYVLLTLLSIATEGLAPTAIAQVTGNRSLEAYAGRMNDRRSSTDQTFIANQRVNGRMNTRINTRLQTRLERFSDGETNENWAYTPQVDDGTRRTSQR